MHSGNDTNDMMGVDVILVVCTELFGFEFIDNDIFQ